MDNRLNISSKLYKPELHQAFTAEIDDINYCSGDLWQFDLPAGNCMVSQSVGISVRSFQGWIVSNFLSPWIQAAHIFMSLRPGLHPRHQKVSMAFTICYENGAHPKKFSSVTKRRLEIRFHWAWFNSIWIDEPF